MRFVVARVLFALLVFSAIVALRPGAGPFGVSGSGQNVSSRLLFGTPHLGRFQRASGPGEDTRHVSSSPSHPSPRPNKQRRLCVIAPHRPRDGNGGSSDPEPERFAAYFARWLPRVANVQDFSVFVVEQEDEYRFNRGWLMNIGVAVARVVDGCQIFALHDVDLLPVDARLPYGSYGQSEEGDSTGTLGTGGGFGVHEKKKEAKKHKVPSPTHLSPPGVHPEYVYPSFKGGAWLFTWTTLLELNGYANVFWGWGREDDDLGARMRDANVSVENFKPETSGIAEVDDLASRCTGLANHCLDDPTVVDCFGDLPYETFKKRVFRDVPPQTLQGLRFKKGRSVSQGTCFAHAHQGNYSRDELGKRSSKKSDETHVPVTTPDREFMRGRNWPDVRSGKFRKDSTSGLSGLFNRRGFTDVGREQIKENTETRPAPNHGFSILGLEVVQVAVRRGVARAVGVNQHPCLKKNPDFENTHRWSGNAFLEEAIGNGEDRNSKQTEARTQATPKAPSFVRIRVRLTCDEEDAPWCVDETRVGAADGFRV